MRAPVTTRPVLLPDDADFLLMVYHSTRQAELELVAWPEADKNAFVRSQFEAQSRHYSQHSPHAENSVVLVGGVPAGRLIVERSEGALHIKDIALLPPFRRAGAGSELVNRLIDEAEQRGVPVTCYVEAGNEAFRFWERLGFVACGSDGVYAALERPCGTSRH
jgi:ribosomal protein S18 acetylase RimI-like enzyme